MTMFEFINDKLIELDTDDCADFLCSMENLNNIMKNSNIDMCKDSIMYFALKYDDVRMMINKFPHVDNIHNKAISSEIKEFNELLKIYVDYEKL